MSLLIIELFSMHNSFETCALTFIRKIYDSDLKFLLILAVYQFFEQFKFHALSINVFITFFFLNSSQT